MYYIGVRDGKGKKKAQINLSILSFFPTIYLATLKGYTKFEDFGSHWSGEEPRGAEKSMTENLNGKKEKLTKE